VLWVWDTFRPGGEAVLEKLSLCRSSAEAIKLLSSFPGFGGTGFSAATVVHFLADADKKLKILGWKQDDPGGPTRAS